MITITKYGGLFQLPHKTFTFPGGEVGVKLDTEAYAYLGHPSSHILTARLQNSADVMELVMVVDALRRLDPNPIVLRLPYVPYGRQDRVCVPGEAHSLKAFASLVNSLGFERVVTFDPHSDVTGALLNNVGLVDQKTILGCFDKLNQRIINDSNLVLVSPDAGSNKKTADLAAHYGHSSFLRADKLRDLATGKIKEIVVVNPEEEVKGRNCLIVDDLADGAATFVGLAAALKAKGAARVELYVTHGLWSKGIAHVLDGGVDHIWCTNAYHLTLKHLEGGLAEGRFTWLDLDEVFPL